MYSGAFRRLMILSAMRSRSCLFSEADLRSLLAGISASADSSRATSSSPVISSEK